MCVKWWQTAAGNLADSKNPQKTRRKSRENAGNSEGTLPTLGRIRVGDQEIAGFSTKTFFSRPATGPQRAPLWPRGGPGDVGGARFARAPHAHMVGAVPRMCVAVGGKFTGRWNFEAWTDTPSSWVNLSSRVASEFAPKRIWGAPAGINGIP